MKKGLLSILAASAVLVGCQNYDDQFDALNTQITQLKSTVDGLAGVQSDVAALKGLITSLQTEVGSVQSTLSSDLADALAAIEAVEEQVNDVASGEDLQQVQDDLTAVSTDVSDILESNNVYSDDVIVNSVGTLDFAVALGSKLSIVNGNVVFIVNSEMDIAKVQEAIDNIGIVVNEFAYMAKSSTVSNVNFDSMTSASDIEVAQSGSYSFASLTSAKNITLGSNYSSKVTGVSMPELKTVGTFTTGSVSEGNGANGADYVNGPGTTNHKIAFVKANSIDLNKLTRYGATLELAVDEGGTIGIAALDDVDVTGAQSNIDLKIEGPSSITIENFKDGTLEFTNVGDVVVNNFEGPFTLNAGVVNFKADKAIKVTTASATDLEEFEITGLVDPDDATQKGPTVAFDGNSNIRIIKLKGTIDDVNLNNNSDLEEAHINANVSDQIKITNNSSLIAVNTKDSKATGVKVSGNSDLEALTIETTTVDGPDTDTKVDGTYEVTNNASLLSLTIATAKVQALTITGNDDMTTLDLKDTKTLGDTTTGRSLRIYGNDLTATRGNDSNDSASPGKSGDEGGFSESAGMKSAFELIKAMIADAEAEVYVYFDTVETFQGEDAVPETNDHTFDTTAIANNKPTFASQDQRIVVAHRDSDDSKTGKDPIKAKRSVLVTGMVNNSTVTIGANNAAILTAAAINSANDQVNVNAIINETSLANADAAGVSLTATKYAAPKISIVFSANSADDENSKTVAIAGSLSTHVSDTLTLTVDGDEPAVISSAHTTAAAVASALKAAWDTANSDDDLSNWTADSDTVSGTITFTAKDKGTSQIGAPMTFVHEVASETRSNLGYEIFNAYDGSQQAGGGNAISADNVARGEGIVVTLVADTAGISLSEIGQVGADSTTLAARALQFTVANADAVELDSSFRNNSSLDATTAPITADNVYPSESRADVAYAEDAVAGSESTATVFDRHGWLKD